MSLGYDRARLEKILGDFCIITGLSVSVLDAGSQVIAACNDRPPCFCEEIQKASEGHEKCRCSDRILLEKCREEKRAVSHICHAGLQDAALPLLQGERLLGYVLVGRIRVSDFDAVCERLTWLTVEREILREQYDKITAYDRRQIESVYELAAVLVSFLLTNNILRAQDGEFAERAAAYIEAHLSEPLSVGRICRALGVSKSSLYEKFRAVFGQTFGEYLTDRRLERAHALVCGSTLSMAEIAERVGIGSYTYFSRRFKKKYGEAPRQYSRVKYRYNL